jgi:omega-hydroxy-beta-dihydromenaquinone-9 sulfotransferase
MRVPARAEMGADAMRLWLARWLFTPLAGVTFGDLARLLGHDGAAISLHYWPRTAFTLGMSVLNSALARREARRQAAVIERVQVRRPVFVLGHHRSGTTHLWNLLSQDPRFAYPTVLQAVFPHTFLTFEGAASSWAERLAPRKRPQDNVRFGPHAPIEEERAICTASFLSLQMARHFPRLRERFKAYLTMRGASAEDQRRWQTALDRFARKLLVRNGADRTLLFKAADHTGKIPLILDLYPDARFVHIHRDPYQVYRSTLKMERDTIPLYAYQTGFEEGLVEFILWRYRAMYDAFFEACGRVPARQFVEITFAELEDDPLGVVERIYGTLDLGDFASVRAPLERYLRAMAGYQKNTYRALPEATRRRVADAWRPCFARWGYPE